MKLHIESRDLGDTFGDFIDITPSLRANDQKRIYSIPTPSGTGQLQRFLLRKGLEINFFDAEFHRPVTMDVDIHYPHLEISYTTSGSGSWSASSQEFAMTPGMSSLIYVQEANMVAQLHPNEQMQHMELRIDLRCFNHELPELERLTSRSVYCKQTAGSAQIPLLVEQMKQCPYQGSLQRLYLEGKALELLAFHLDGLEEKESAQQITSKLTADDIQCLYEAKDILTRTWRQPPSLLGLARLTGLNDYKLKLGFKALFGTTVFGYVRELRMNEARRVLERGEANVSQTAMMVGYHNVSHFASLFRKTYGYNPSECGRLTASTSRHELHKI
ncbi:AraC family transcriptional regulator [Paenibacillus sp. E194]|uniref:helix-turn-helix transcriptional regulator n=1 Tax=Paenibacillus sp. E194 TaxID=1458845 RepID=UPI0005C8235B|nr:helix-turn-helix transcriptional regulator [Paenibacillus sp. E194]KJB86755.1 AraC family transcriptional regulator [Paenibacillus sp. E194]